MDQESPSGGEQWHELSPKRVATILDTNLEGLSVAEAARRLQASGPNELQALDTPGPLSLFLKQLANPLIIMLLIAAGVSFLARHPVDGVVILLVVVFECVIGTVQEWRAERALEALEQLAAPHARVVRDAEVRIVDAADVVPGDVLQLETGDRIAADVRLVETAELAIDESAFTGESDPVEKRVAAVCAETPTPDRLNMAWASTTVTRGRGLGLVVETGMRTAIGRIAEDVQTTRREATPLQKRLGQLAVFMGFIAIGAAVAIFVLGMLRGFALVEMLLFAVAAAVSAVPEGLPAVVTVVLAAGVQRMSRRNAIIRRLPAVETLGSTTVVCSDKTGTITRNQMTVRRIWTGDGAYRLEGDGFEPVGAILDDSDVLVDLETAGPSGLRLLLLIGLLANNAILELEGSEWKVQGNPTDGALLVAGHKAHLHLEELEVEHERLDEIPLSSTHKYAATLHEWDGAPRLLVKGAPERLLKASTHLLAGDGPRELTDALRSTILQASDELAGQGLRVIAGACRDLRDDASDANRDDAESDLVFVGMWGLLDPPRDDAITAIAAARRAGMRVVMITGDHASTAMAIARAVGIADHDEQAVSGEDLDAMSDSDLEARVGSVSVYARVEPEHKLRIVTALKSLGETVAMTGDGVNDAP
ncbi:MAG: HAD-IC family P-type ATPase, partial [Coriobacteriia bacterium]|nr:HAD-IC family P-type ATPase [Coriobacteriia bacterium]